MLMPDEDARPGIKLEFIRRQKGISRKELADKLEIAPGALFNLENGFNPIHFDDALKLGNALDVEPDIFIDESARFCASGYGEKIRIIRRACDATQEEFSKMIGVTRSTLSCWEAEIGEYHPSSVFYYKLKEIAEEKNIDINRLNSDPDSFIDDYELFLTGDYGKKIKYIRSAYGVTQTEFCNMIGYTSGTSSCNWESMTEKPLRKAYNRIKFVAEAKGIDINKLNANPDYYKDEYSRFVEKNSGAKIRYIRLQYRAFTDDFGKMLGCSGNAVCTWERGQCIMGRQYFDELKKLAEAKEINLESLDDNPDVFKDDYDRFCVTGCGKKLRYIRNICGMSAEKYAEVIGVSRQTIFIWESELVQRGTIRRPGRENFEKIKQVAIEHGIDLDTIDEELAKVDDYEVFCQNGFGAKIKSLRNVYGMSQRAFSELVGVSVETISRWEREGKVRGKIAFPSKERFRKFKRLAEEKGVDFLESC